MAVWKSSGKIKYDPRVERGTFKENWIILQCDREIIRYYQHIFYKLYWKKLQTPMWKGHISIVRGETPLKPENWKLYNGKEIEFSYSFDGEFKTNGQYFWLSCWSKDFSLIRTSLGLRKDPFVPYHISIGSINN